MTGLSIAAGLALVQETSYRASHPRQEETDAELAARGCMYHYRMHPGTVILHNGRILDSGSDGAEFMTIEQRPVLILSEGRPDTTSDPFGRELTAYRARDLLSGREGKLTFGARGVVRTEPMLPWAPLAAAYARQLADLAAWENEGGA
jgi:hypothetical protein